MNDYAYDFIRKLKHWLQPTEHIFRDLQQYVLGDVKQHRIFIDRGGSVLFVAHLDSVQKPNFIRYRKTKSGKIKRIYASGLDDRLGAMLAFVLSKELKADLLLTDYEERMQTTAKYHNCKDYNWIVEFDRAGYDVVTYDLSSIEFDNTLQEYWSVNYGAYSDICELKTDACCFNLGIGYELAHSRNSYCDVKTVKQQIELFRRFYVTYKDVQFKQDEKSDYWQDNYTIDRCDICGMVNAELMYSWYICQDCFEQMVYEKVLEREQSV